MGLYNIIYGQNAHANRLLDMLQLKQQGSVYPRGYDRDIYLNDNATEIVIYTSDEGGNRDCRDNESNKDCDCTGCIMTYDVPNHPNYLRDENYSPDHAYAKVYYSIPEQYQEECNNLIKLSKVENLLKNVWRGMLM
jgi:hypothetical protein